jgi:thioredoxin reductase (NADPH)
LAQLQQQQGGYLCTDSWRRSSLAGVYAIGDIASPDLQSVVTAIADGAIAAKAIMHDLDKRI